MANEAAEFTRYWGECLGRIILPKSKSKRLFQFIGVDDPRSGPFAVSNDAEFALRVLTSTGEWRTRTLSKTAFDNTAILFIPRSQFLNTSRTCVYYNHSVERQFMKGITKDMAISGLQLQRNMRKTPLDWEAKEEDGLIHPNYMSFEPYFLGYDQPYPSFQKIHQQVVSGKRLSGAFSRDFALFNLPQIKDPVLYRTSWKAGYVKGDTLYLARAHSPVVKFLEKKTGLPVKIVENK